MTNNRPLTDDEITALAAYAAEKGRYWKAALRKEWMNATTTGTLQALRNSHGPSWLVDYRIKRPVIADRMRTA